MRKKNVATLIDGPGPSPGKFVYLPVSQYLAAGNSSGPAITHLTTTRNHIIDLAEELIRTKGYNAFSYSDISEALNIRNAAIHYYFPSKTDLGISVVDREVDNLTKSRSESADQPAAGQLRKLIGTFYDSSRKGWICLNGSLTPDYITLPEPLQKKVKNMSQTVLDWMKDCLEKGQKDHTLQFEGDPADRALVVMSTLLASLLLSRVLGRDTFDRMSDQVEKDLKIYQTQIERS